MSSKRRVAYVYHPDIKSYNYGPDHPMKPKRVAMTHDLIEKYGMYHDMKVYRSFYATDEEMMLFHSPDYIEFMNKYFYLSAEKRKNPYFGIGMSTDIPAFPNFFQFNQLVSGSSILAAQLIEENQADIVVNWLGGFHHAKRFKASGFCYCNDIVLGIQHLLRTKERILYIDIDVHHGDGVEEAFLTTNRVMTVSFHQYDEKEKFFPGTGSIKDVGEGDGKYYAINVPLRPGCTDESYGYLFPIIMDKVMEVYRPDAIWLQCGADSLHGDLIGGFNVTTKGHGAAIQHMLKFGKPIVLVGGGGYTIENVSRAWAYETSICLGKQLDNKLPENLEYADSYKDEPVLHYKNVKNVYQEQNDKEYLNEIVRRTFDNLKKIDFAPNILSMEVPTDYKLKDEKVWQEGNDSKVLDQFIFKEKGVQHLEENTDDKPEIQENLKIPKDTAQKYLNLKNLIPKR